MEIYLIRHTTPLVDKGTCYGQADLDVTDTFEQEAACVKQHIPPHVKRVYSSPLKRCKYLAQYLFPQHHIHFDERIMEISCGEWELQPWDAIDRQHLDAWMSDFVNVCIPGGESYVHLYNRVVQFFDEISANLEPTAIVAHGGVLRSLLAYINQLDLKDSFNAYAIRYGCVIRLHVDNENLRHTILHNPESEKEQHRPVYY